MKIDPRCLGSPRPGSSLRDWSSLMGVLFLYLFISVDGAEILPDSTDTNNTTVATGTSSCRGSACIRVINESGFDVLLSTASSEMESLRRSTRKHFLNYIEYRNNVANWEHSLLVNMSPLPVRFSCSGWGVEDEIEARFDLNGTDYAEIVSPVKHVHVCLSSSGRLDTDHIEFGSPLGGYVTIVNIHSGHYGYRSVYHKASLVVHPSTDTLVVRSEIGDVVLKKNTGLLFMDTLCIGTDSLGSINIGFCECTTCDSLQKKLGLYIAGMFTSFLQIYGEYCECFESRAEPEGNGTRIFKRNKFASCTENGDCRFADRSGQCHTGMYLSHPTLDTSCSCAHDDWVIGAAEESRDSVTDQSFDLLIHPSGPACSSCMFAGPNFRHSDTFSRMTILNCVYSAIRMGIEPTTACSFLPYIQSSSLQANELDPLLNYHFTNFFGQQDFLRFSNLINGFMESPREHPNLQNLTLVKDSITSLRWLEVFDGLVTHYLSECVGEESTISTVDAIGSTTELNATPLSSVCVPLARSDSTDTPQHVSADYTDNEYRCLNAECRLIPLIECYRLISRFTCGSSREGSSSEKSCSDIFGANSDIIFYQHRLGEQEGDKGAPEEYNSADTTSVQPGEQTRYYVHLPGNESSYTELSPEIFSPHGFSAEVWVSMDESLRVKNLASSADLISFESSSDWGYEYHSGLAVDSDLSTYWSSPLSGTENLLSVFNVHFENTIYGNGIEIVWEHQACDFTVETSHDGYGWNILQAFRGNNDSFTKVAGYFKASILRIKMTKAIRTRRDTLSYPVDPRAPPSEKFVYSIREITVNEAENLFIMKPVRVRTLLDCGAGNIINPSLPSSLLGYSDKIFDNHTHRDHNLYPNEYSNSTSNCDTLLYSLNHQMSSVDRVDYVSTPSSSLYDWVKTDCIMDGMEVASKQVPVSNHSFPFHPRVLYMDMGRVFKNNTLLYMEFGSLLGPYSAEIFISDIDIRDEEFVYTVQTGSYHLISKEYLESHPLEFRQLFCSSTLYCEGGSNDESLTRINFRLSNETRNLDENNPLIFLIYPNTTSSNTDTELSLRHVLVILNTSDECHNHFGEFKSSDMEIKSTKLANPLYGLIEFNSLRLYSESRKNIDPNINTHTHRFYQNGIIVEHGNSTGDYENSTHDHQDNSSILEYVTCIRNLFYDSHSSIDPYRYSSLSSGDEFCEIPLPFSIKLDLLSLSDLITTHSSEFVNEDFTRQNVTYGSLLLKCSFPRINGGEIHLFSVPEVHPLNVENEETEITNIYFPAGHNDHDERINVNTIISVFLEDNIRTLKILFDTIGTTHASELRLHSLSLFPLGTDITELHEFPDYPSIASSGALSFSESSTSRVHDKRVTDDNSGFGMPLDESFLEILGTTRGADTSPFTLHAKNDGSATFSIAMRSGIHSVPGGDSSVSSGLSLIQCDKRLEQSEGEHAEIISTSVTLDRAWTDWVDTASFDLFTLASSNGSDHLNSLRHLIKTCDFVSVLTNDTVMGEETISETGSWPAVFTQCEDVQIYLQSANTLVFTFVIRENGDTHLNVHENLCAEYVVTRISLHLRNLNLTLNDDKEQFSDKNTESEINDPCLIIYSSGITPEAEVVDKNGTRDLLDCVYSRYVRVLKINISMTDSRSRSQTIIPATLTDKGTHAEIEVDYSGGTPSSNPEVDQNNTSSISTDTTVFNIIHRQPDDANSEPLKTSEIIFKITTQELEIPADVVGLQLRFDHSLSMDGVEMSEGNREQSVNVTSSPVANFLFLGCEKDLIEECNWSYQDIIGVSKLWPENRLTVLWDREQWKSISFYRVIPINEAAIDILENLIIAQFIIIHRVRVTNSLESPQPGDGLHIKNPLIYISDKITDSPSNLNDGSDSTLFVAHPLATAIEISGNLVDDPTEDQKLFVNRIEITFPYNIAPEDISIHLWVSRCDSGHTNQQWDLVNGAPIIIDKVSISIPINMVCNCFRMRIKTSEHLSVMQRISNPLALKEISVFSLSDLQLGKRIHTGPFSEEQNDSLEGEEGSSRSLIGGDLRSADQNDYDAHHVLNDSNNYWLSNPGASESALEFELANYTCIGGLEMEWTIVPISFLLRYDENPPNLGDVSHLSPRWFDALEMKDITKGSPVSMRVGDSRYIYYPISTTLGVCTKRFQIFVLEPRVISALRSSALRRLRITSPGQECLFGYCHLNCCITNPISSGRSESANAAFDRDSKSSWTVYGVDNSDTWLTIDLRNDKKNVRISRITITWLIDFVPKVFSLEGIKSDGDVFTVIDNKSNEDQYTDIICTIEVASIRIILPSNSKRLDLAEIQVWEASYSIQPTEVFDRSTPPLTFSPYNLISAPFRSTRKDEMQFSDSIWMAQPGQDAIQIQLDLCSIYQVSEVIVEWVIFPPDLLHIVVEVLGTDGRWDVIPMSIYGNDYTHINTTRRFFRYLRVKIYKSYDDGLNRPPLLGVALKSLIVRKYTNIALDSMVTTQSSVLVSNHESPQDEAEELVDLQDWWNYPVRNLAKEPQYPKSSDISDAVYVDEILDSVFWASQQGVTDAYFIARYEKLKNIAGVDVYPMLPLGNITIYSSIDCFSYQEMGSAIGYLNQDGDFSYDLKYFVQRILENESSMSSNTSYHLKEIHGSSLLDLTDEQTSTSRYMVSVPNDLQFAALCVKLVLSNPLVSVPHPESEISYQDVKIEDLENAENLTQQNIRFIAIRKVSFWEHQGGGGLLGVWICTQCAPMSSCVHSVYSGITYGMIPGQFSYLSYERYSSPSLVLTPLTHSYDGNSGNINIGELVHVVLSVTSSTAEIWVNGQRVISVEDRDDHKVSTGSDLSQLLQEGGALWNCSESFASLVVGSRPMTVPFSRSQESLDENQLTAEKQTTPELSGNKSYEHNIGPDYVYSRREDMSSLILPDFRLNVYTTCDIYSISMIKGPLTTREVIGLYESIYGFPERACHCGSRVCPFGEGSGLSLIPCSGKGVCRRGSRTEHGLVDGNSGIYSGPGLNQSRDPFSIFAGLYEDLRNKYFDEQRRTPLGHCSCFPGFVGDNCETHCSDLGAC